MSVPSIYRYFTTFAALLILSGCATEKAYRQPIPEIVESPAQCKAVFDAAVGSIADIQSHIKGDLQRITSAQCWNSSWEKHTTYDLFTLEFDDQGWLTGSGEDKFLAPHQFSRLMEQLKRMTDMDGQPLSIIVYTHGWHHTAAPDDDNMIAFRQLLDAAALTEQRLCMERTGRANWTTPRESCEESDLRKANPYVHHVVGIYVGWRGNSILGPGLEYTSIWDRKLAAEKVAFGSVQDFHGLMHQFWMTHACHISSTSKSNCVDIRLLNIGHSFGGLITYRGLAPRLIEGLVETNNSLEEGQIQYAHGFGDLTVLINPAFEGTRFEPVALAATNRNYQDSEHPGSTERTAQLPLLIVAQSEGDDATHYMFPLFRSGTTIFESVSGDESAPNLGSVGWSQRYLTHSLTFNSKSDACGGISTITNFDEKLKVEMQWSHDKLNNNYRDFNADELKMCDGLILSKINGDNSAARLGRPPYMPLWVVKVDTQIIKDHDDFLNPRFVDFIRQIYYTIQRATDHLAEQRCLHPKPVPSPAPQSCSLS